MYAAYDAGQGPEQAPDNWVVINSGVTAASIDELKSKEAMQIAGVIRKANERGRTDANRSGAWIASLPGYIVRQSHDQAKISKADFKVWRDYTLARIDWKKTADGAFDPKNYDKALNDFLYSTWTALASGMFLKNDLPTRNPLASPGGMGSNAAQMTHERVLHFKAAQNIIYKYVFKYTHEKCQACCYSARMENFPFLNEALIQVVKQLRSEAGYSQQRLAEKSAIDRLYILQLEQGKFRPTLNSIFFLARGLGISPDEFVRLIEQERQNMEHSHHEESG